MDALDWFRCRFYPEHYPPGSFPWEQFIRYAVHCTNKQGSALYDATLGDQELIDQMYDEAKAEQSSKVRKAKDEEELDPRPPRRGYSREVEAIYDLTDNIVALRAEMGRWPPFQTAKAFAPRPWFPAEVVQERMRKRAKRRVNQAVARAQSQWWEQNDNAGVRT